MSLTTGILLFEGYEELDFAGPWEVWGMAAGVREGDGERDRVVAIAEHGDPVRAYNGMRVVPDYTFANAPRLDILVVPGGLGTRKQMNNEVLLAWLRQASASCRWVTSVCTGSMLLLAAGIAKNKRITTHWIVMDELRKMGGAEIVDGVRFVRDGNLVTSEGVSAGIDMSLWVVGQVYGVEHARKTQRMMQYDPAPPYTADV